MTKPTRSPHRGGRRAPQKCQSSALYRAAARAAALAAILTVAAGVLSVLRGQPAPGPAFEATVGATAVAAPAGRTGINLQISYLNNWTRDPGFEPVVVRPYGVATGGGSGFIENDGSPDTTFDQSFTDGFFDGATVRVYREANGAMSLLRTDTVERYYASAASWYWIDLTDDNGPPVQAGDLYFIDLVADDVPLASVHPDARPAVEFYDSWLAMGSASLSRDRANNRPGSGGQTVLRAASSDTSPGGFFQVRYGSEEATQESLVPGRTYRAEIWLRQVGVAGGSVFFWVDGGNGESAEVVVNGVTGQWQPFSFDFVAPARPEGVGGTGSHGFGFVGPGTVWADDFFLYDPAAPHFELEADKRTALEAFAPGTVRIWSGQSNEQLGTTLEDWTDPEAQELRQYHRDFGAQPPDTAYKLPQALPLVESLGADLWLTVGVFMDESEWAGLIEFLAGPAGTPYGDKRIAQGRAAPWTDAFARIYLEFGNETWNPDFVWRLSPGTYGRLGELMFTAARNSPHFAAVAHKFEFVLNGMIEGSGTDGFGQLALAGSPSAHRVSIAGYVGGFERGINFASFEEFLHWGAAHLGYHTAEHAATRDALNAQGTAYELAGYEGGPGYPLPPWPQVAEPQMEAYGKSLAGAVATVDLFLDQDRHGVGPGCYFEFKAGQSYASHTSDADGFRPHPSTLALGLLNERLPGAARVPVTVHASPQVLFAGDGERPDQVVPLVDCHAFRAGAETVVVAFSREVVDTLPVTLRLPFDHVGSATLYALRGDPAATNWGAMNVAVETEPAAFGGSLFSFDLPPASVAVFTFSGTAVDAAVAPSIVVSPEDGQESPTVEEEVRFAVTLDRPVVGLEASDLIVGGTAAGAAAASLEEVGPFDGTRFRARVTGVTASGTINVAVPAGSTHAAVGGLANTASSALGGPVEVVRLVAPALSAPAEGSVLPGADVTFSWSPNDFTVEEWYLDIGSGPGWADLFEGGYPGTVLSQAVTGLPEDGRAIHATLYYRVGWDWFIDAAGYTAAIALPTGDPGLVTPAGGSTLPGTSVTFTWDGHGHPVDYWWVDIGNQPDGAEYFTSGFDGAVTSASVSGLPADGSAVFLRLWSLVDGSWGYEDSVFSAAAGP